MTNVEDRLTSVEGRLTEIEGTLGTVLHGVTTIKNLLTPPDDPLDVPRRTALRRRG